MVQLSTPTLNLSDTIHFVTDRQTDVLCAAVRDDWLKYTIKHKKKPLNKHINIP